MKAQVVQVYGWAHTNKRCGLNNTKEKFATFFSFSISLPLFFSLSLSLSCGGYKVFAPNATSHFYRRQKIGLNKWNKWFESWWTTSFCPIKLKKDPEKLIFFPILWNALWGNRPEERVTHRSAASNSNFACPTSHILIGFDLLTGSKFVQVSKSGSDKTGAKIKMLDLG